MAPSSFRKDSGAGLGPLGPGMGRDVVPRAVQRVTEYEHFRSHAQSIAFEFDAGILTVTGTLPSFYLKQVLQTILRDMSGVARIDNRVAVIPYCHMHDKYFSPSGNSEK